MTDGLRFAAAREQLTAVQQAAHDELLRRRGKVSAPYLPLLASPAVTDAFERFSSAAWAGQVPRDVQEAIFLLTARLHDCSHQWRTHEDKARQAGVPQAAIESLRQGRVPTVAEAGERLAEILRLAADLHLNKAVSEGVFAAATRHLDDRGTSDLMAFLALAAGVALLLNVRVVPTASPPGAQVA